MFTAVYVIYSADIIGTDAEIEAMAPNRVAIGHAGLWRLASGDERYEYAYLAEGSGDGRYHRAGDPEAPPEACGHHRTWVAELTREQWQEFADAFAVELDEDLVPERYENTLGSITPEHGLIPAISVDNTDGWDPSVVISSTFYVSFSSPEAPRAGQDAPPDRLAA
jgi:hypothetical protein